MSALKKFIPVWLKIILSLLIKPRSTVTSLYLSVHHHKSRWDALHKGFRNIQMSSLDGDYVQFGCHHLEILQMAKNLSGYFNLKPHFYCFENFGEINHANNPKNMDCNREDLIKSKNERFLAAINAIFKPDEHTGVPLTDANNDIEQLHKKLPIKKAAIVFLDCYDYRYASNALKFIERYLQTGTILYLKDYYATSQNPNSGEEGAVRSFLVANPHWEFKEWDTFSEFGKSFIVVKKAEVRPSPLNAFGMTSKNQ